jgi:hypothetical protein
LVVHCGWQLPAEQKSPHGQSLLRAQVRPPSLSFGCGAHVPETQAGPLIDDPPSARQSQLVVHWPGRLPLLPVPLELLLLPLELWLLPLELLLPLLTTQVPALQISPVGQGVFVPQSTQTPSLLQLPASSALLQSTSLEQGMDSPESVLTAVLGLHEVAKKVARTVRAAAARGEMGANLFMEAFLGISCDAERTVKRPGRSNLYTSGIDAAGHADPGFARFPLPQGLQC